MPTISAPQELVESDVYIDTRDMTGRALYLKVDGLNFGGSVKLRVAASMVEAAERDGLIGPDSILVESSSGNLGIALSMVAANKGLRFVCVTDIRCNPVTVRLMRSLGAEVMMVDQPNRTGGLLGARHDRVRRLCAENPRAVWLNQYANQANWAAHYRTTAPEIMRRFPDLDVLFLGVGTAGTLMGCISYLRDHGYPTRVVAVDAEGSVSFGGPSGRRLIPGLGAAVRPVILNRDAPDAVCHVAEIDAIRTCRMLAGHGFLLGGSTGTVLSGALSWLGDHDPDGLLQAVALSPDLGERYIDTIYDDAWVGAHFGAEALWGDCRAVAGRVGEAHS